MSRFIEFAIFLQLIAISWQLQGTLTQTEGFILNILGLLSAIYGLYTKE